MAASTMTKHHAAQLVQFLKTATLSKSTRADASKLLAAIEKECQRTARQLQFLTAAQAAATEGGLEVDADAVVSEGDDAGAYVQAWVWVSDEQAGVTEQA